MSGAQRRQLFRAQIFARDGGRCVFCKQTEPLTIHHIRPRALGGSDAPLNLVTLCQPCHDDLNDMTMRVGNWIIWLNGVCRILRARLMERRQRAA
jgi:5-methylcytosine-specific restriction endonuclease McrA